jgi:hypothetical protein
VFSHCPDCPRFTIGSFLSCFHPCPVGGKQEVTFNDREREATVNLTHLADLKLLHPPRTRQQIERWQELLSETIALLKLLSSSKTCPSNTAAAAAAVVGARGLQMPQDSAQLEGLLHGVPREDRDRRAAWRKLSGHMDRLLVLLDKEVGVLELGVGGTVK